MKKLLIALSFMLAFAGIATAQEARKKLVPKAAKMEKVKPAVTATPATEAAGPKKADGTLDRRFKANKGKTVPAGKTKRDGTPDMRYKENKPKKG